MSVVAERAREYAAALREARMGPVSLANILDSVAPMMGAGIGMKLKDVLLTNKTAVKLFQKFKEWGGLIAGVGITLIYDMLRGRLPNNAFLDFIVGGLAADLGSESFATIFGMPYAIVLDDGTLYVKNIAGTTLTVYIDGQRYTYDVNNKTWSGPSNVAEGVHDIVVVGTEKGYYIRQYTPAITVGTSSAGGTA